MKSSIFINRILRNTFPINFYYHFSLVNLTAATESATSYEHAHCAWYTKSLMDMNRCISVIDRCTCIDANRCESAPEGADPASKSDLCTFITILDIDRCTFISNDAPGRLIDAHASMQTGVDPRLGKHTYLQTYTHIHTYINADISTHAQSYIWIVAFTVICMPRYLLLGDYCSASWIHNRQP